MSKSLFYKYIFFTKNKISFDACVKKGKFLHGEPTSNRESFIRFLLNTWRKIVSRRKGQRIVVTAKIQSVQMRMKEMS